MGLLIARVLILSIIVAGSLSCCGGGSTTTATTAPLANYRFTAIVESGGGPNAPLPLATGDTISGNFTFDPALAGVHSFVQKDPAGVEVIFGQNVVKADLSNWLGYQILVNNDVSDPSGSKDAFRFWVNCTSVPASYNVDVIQVSLSLGDSTGKVFNAPVIPEHLDLNKFDEKLIFLNGVKTIDGGESIQWTYRAQITSLEQVQ